MIFLSRSKHFSFCGVYTGFCSKQMAEMLPKADIIVILARRELCYIKRFIGIYHIGFWSCTAQ